MYKRQIHERGEFLYNAKPRFGKTLTVYDLAKRMHLEKVLIVTNRPAIANSWYEDYCKFLGTESGFSFVSEVDALKTQPHAVSYTHLSKQSSDGFRKRYLETLLYERSIIK